MVSFFKLFFISFFCFGCTSLIYQPDRYLHADPTSQKIKFHEFYLRSLDQTKLLAWQLESKTSNPENLVLMFHGNAENLSSHVFNLTWMLDYKTDVLIFDYRGYGLSEGTPYPRGVVEDGIVFLEYAYKKFKEGHYKRFIVYTQSLGGAIAMRALEDINWRDEISLLVLDSTFISPQDIASSKTHGLFWWLVSSEYTANKNLGHLTMPLLVMHAPHDPVIPFKFGEDIFKTAPSKNKLFWTIENGSHGDVFFVDKGKYRKPFLDLIMLHN